jgi:nucleotide-binding universal stress UspA family protein
MNTTHLLIIALDSEVPDDVPEAEVLVVAPALNSWLRRWVSDEDAARSRAEQRAAALVDKLARRGIHAEGRVGDADPVQAIADALVTFPADEIVISAAPKDAAPRLEKLASRARRRFAAPISRSTESLPLAA